MRVLYECYLCGSYRRKRIVLVFSDKRIILPNYPWL
jgi:hypothetical protein